MSRYVKINLNDVLLTVEILKPRLNLKLLDYCYTLEIHALHIIENKFDFFNIRKSTFRVCLRLTKIVIIFHSDILQEKKFL